MVGDVAVNDAEITDGVDVVFDTEDSCIGSAGGGGGGGGAGAATGGGAGICLCG